MNSNHWVIKWGKTKNDKQCWYCKECQHFFIWKKKKAHHKKWFLDWLGGMSAKQVAEKVSKSTKTIQREINFFLKIPPKPKIIPNKKAHLLIDGTYFKRENCLIIYHDRDLKHHQLWSYVKGEKKYQIESDLRELKRAGVDLFSATTDGNAAVRSALLKVYPKAIHQRCLVHIQRFAEIHLTKNPKTKAGRELKEIVSCLNFLNSHLAKRTFLGRLERWKGNYLNFLKEKTYSEDRSFWWYTHRNLRRVIFHIESALPDMFRYLIHKEIPKDTNGLEGRFKDLKHKFADHGGLKKEKRTSYFSWYLTLKNQK